MDYKIKITLIATTVSSVLGSTAFATTSSQSSTQALTSLDLNAVIASKKQHSTINKKINKGQGNNHPKVDKMMQNLNIQTAAQNTDIMATGVVLDNHNNTVNGAFCDVDDILDVGETAMLKVTLMNNSSDELSGITATVTSSADVGTANDGAINFDPVAQDASTTGMVEITLNSADTNEAIDVTITFMSDDETITLPEPVTTTFHVNRDQVQDRGIEDFETPANTWAQWSRTMETATGEDPEHFLSQWAVFDDADFGYVAFAPNLSQANDISLLTPSVTVADSGEFIIEFEHYYDFEMGDIDDLDDMTLWDGGVVEVSIDSGDWTDVVTAGGSFTIGYNGAIAESNPTLPGRDGFVGLIDTLWITGEALSFPEGSLNGKDVQFRFRVGSNGSVAAWGWNIDNVSFANATTDTPFISLIADSGVCVNRAPVIVSASAPQNVIEGGSVTLTANGSDADGNALTYAWMLGDALVSTSQTFDYTAPAVSEDTEVVFSVTASDDTETGEATLVTVNVIANQTPTVTADQTSLTIREGESVTLSVAATDPEGDDLTYSWTMDGTALDNTGTTFEYTAPSVSSDTTVTFSVVASDGDETSTAAQITVNVENRSSGGGMGLFALLLAPLAFIRRRKQR